MFGIWYQKLRWLVIILIKKNKKITNYKIGEKVMELKSNNTIIEYHAGDPKELKCKISNKNINIFEENGSSIELIYYLINDTLVVENYDANKFIKKLYVKENLKFWKIKITIRKKEEMLK